MAYNASVQSVINEMVKKPSHQPIHESAPAVEQTYSIPLVESLCLDLLENNATYLLYEGVLGDHAATFAIEDDNDGFVEFGGDFFLIEDEGEWSIFSEQEIMESLGQTITELKGPGYNLAKKAPSSGIIRRGMGFIRRIGRGIGRLFRGFLNNFKLKRLASVIGKDPERGKKMATKLLRNAGHSPRDAAKLVPSVVNAVQQYSHSRKDFVRALNGIRQSARNGVKANPGHVALLQATAKAEDQAKQDPGLARKAMSAIFNGSKTFTRGTGSVLGSFVGGFHQHMTDRLAQRGGYKPTQDQNGGQVSRQFVQNRQTTQQSQPPQEQPPQEQPPQDQYPEVPPEQPLQAQQQQQQQAPEQQPQQPQQQGAPGAGPVSYEPKRWMHDKPQTQGQEARAAGVNGKYSVSGTADAVTGQTPDGKPISQEVQMEFGTNGDGLANLVQSIMGGGTIHGRYTDPQTGKPNQGHVTPKRITIKGDGKVITITNSKTTGPHGDRMGVTTQGDNTRGTVPTRDMPVQATPGQNQGISQELWAKAKQQANGDVEQAKAIYQQLRRGQQ